MALSSHFCCGKYVSMEELIHSKDSKSMSKYYWDIDNQVIAACFSNVEDEPCYNRMIIKRTTQWIFSCKDYCLRNKKYMVF